MNCSEKLRFTFLSKGGRREIAFANNGKRNDCIGNRYSPELYTLHTTSTRR